MSIGTLIQEAGYILLILTPVIAIGFALLGLRKYIPIWISAYKTRQKA